jgi:hypothetical protein
MDDLIPVTSTTPLEDLHATIRSNYPTTPSAHSIKPAHRNHGPTDPHNTSTTSPHRSLPTISPGPLSTGGRVRQR